MKYITEMIFFFFQTPHHTTFVLRFIQTKFRYKNYIFLSWFHQLHEGKQTLSAEPHSRSGGQTSAGRRKEKQEEKKSHSRNFTPWTERFSVDAVAAEKLDQVKNPTLHSHTLLLRLHTGSIQSFYTVLLHSCSTSLQTLLLWFYFYSV